MNRPKRFSISSQPRYDHFDTSPCMFQSAFIFAQIPLRKLLERKAGEKTEKYSIFHFEIPYISRIPGKQNCQAGIYSESRLFWPLRYCSEASILYNTEIRFASTKFRLNNIIEIHAGLSPMSIPMPIPISALKCVCPMLMSNKAGEQSSLNTWLPAVMKCRNDCRIQHLWMNQMRPLGYTIRWMRFVLYTIFVVLCMDLVQCIHHPTNIFCLMCKFGLTAKPICCTLLLSLYFCLWRLDCIQ